MTGTTFFMSAPFKGLQVEELALSFGSGQAPTDSVAQGVQ